MYPLLEHLIRQARLKFNDDSLPVVTYMKNRPVGHWVLSPPMEVPVSFRRAKVISTPHSTRDRAITRVYIAGKGFDEMIEKGSVFVLSPHQKVQSIGRRQATADVLTNQV